MIERVAVIGAGTMGAAIAQHFLMKNCDVTLVDIDQKFLDRGCESIGLSLAEAVDRKIISNERKESLISKLKTTIDYADLDKCQLVIEAIFENFQVKEDLFIKLEKHVSDTCLLASNTSSFSINDLARKLNRPERFIGIHYFFHAAKNRLVEIIANDKTTPENIDTLFSFYNFIDKNPIAVRDSFGFAVNRFFVPWLNEACRLLEENVGSTKFIDEVATEVFGIGMGPFALMNVTGVPIALHATNTLYEKLGSLYQAAAILERQVEQKRPWVIEDDSSKTNDAEMVKNRLLAIALGVSAQLVSEGVADATSTDLGARLGLRWPVGPGAMINNLGAIYVREVVNELFQKYDLPLPKLLESDEKIEINHIKSKIVNKTGFIGFNRPDSMNALNPEVMAQLNRHFDKLNSNSQIEKIIFYGSGKAFVAGADIKFFIDNIEQDNIDNIYKFTEFGQDLFSKIAESKKITISFIDGLCLGGGLELALCCNYRVVTNKALLAFPETGIGIYPGLGGTQRASRLMGMGVAKFLISTGVMINAQKAKNFGLVDEIIERPLAIEDLVAISPSRNKVDPATLSENSFSDFTGDISEQANYQKFLQRKAPLALSKAMELITKGMELDIGPACKLELDSLNYIFNTADALSGLKSVVERTRPQFRGE